MWQVVRRKLDQIKSNTSFNLAAVVPVLRVWHGRGECHGCVIVLGITVDQNAPELRFANSDVWREFDTG